MKRTNLILLCLMAYMPLFSQVDTIADNIYEYNGKLGIGVNDPSLRFHIRDTNSQLFLGYQPAYDGPYINLFGEIRGETSMLAMGLAQKDYNCYGKIVAKTNWAYLYGNNYNQGIAILPDLAYAPDGLYIARGGLVGIGIEEPSSKLEVNGMIHSTNEGFKFPDGTIQTTAADASDINYWNLSGDNVFYNDGFVGIGTTTFIHPFSVKGTVTNAVLEFGNNNYGGVNYNFIQSYDREAETYRDLKIITKSGAEGGTMYLTTEGNVGIGTITPDARLRIEDNVDGGPERALIRLKNLSTSNTSSVSLGLESNNSENGLALTFTSEQFSSIPDFDRMGVISVNGKGFSVYSTSDYGSIRFYTNMDQNGIIERMRINHDGNIGIGTINPMSKLEVNGMIHSTSEGFKFPDGTIQTTAVDGFGTNLWNMSDNHIYFDLGYVGVGTDEPSAKLEVSDGDIYISDIEKGIIMKSPDGNCWRGTLDNSGTLVFTIIDCPGETENPINIKSAAITSNIAIFPNPVENTVTIASLNGNFRNTEAILYTMDGKVVKRNELNGELALVNISNIPAGSYILKVLDKRGREMGSEAILKN